RALTHDDLPVARSPLPDFVRPVPDLPIKEVHRVPADPAFITLLPRVGGSAEHTPPVDNAMGVVDRHVPARHVDSMEEASLAPILVQVSVEADVRYHEVLNSDPAPCTSHPAPSCIAHGAPATDSNIAHDRHTLCE